MSDYTRRPFLKGKTAVGVYSQPELRGSIPAAADGSVTGMTLPSELLIEGDDGTSSISQSVVFNTSTQLSQVIADINAAIPEVEAVEFEGCLVIRVLGSGEGTFIRLSPAVSFTDAAPLFGFSVHPHPRATVSAGDLIDAPARPRQEQNDVGSKFVATGEDRVGSAYNRALNALGKNTDTNHGVLTAPAAQLRYIEVDETAWAAYIVTNSDGTIDQINLAGVSAVAGVSGRFYVGGMSAASTLDEIAQNWAIMDEQYNELLGENLRAVRVSAVTFGERGVGKPAFTNDFAVPTSQLGDASGTTPDGNNVLGVDRVKSSSVAITSVVHNTTIVCPSATFISDGVVAGDHATIAGATQTSPVSHNGLWMVETVVTETTLILKPHPASDNVRDLNSDTGFDLGAVTISSGGDFEGGAWITFDPPLPRFPASGKIILGLPVETPLSEMSVRSLLEGTVRTSEQVSAWIKQQLWIWSNLDGAYRGQGRANGGGYRIEVRNRPVTMVSRHRDDTTRGSVVRSSTVPATLDLQNLWLVAGAGDSFQETDVGQTVELLTSTSFYASEPWTIIRYLDRRTVELAPPPFRTGYQGSGSEAVTWSIVSNSRQELWSIARMISPEFYGSGDIEASQLGMSFVREQRTETGTDDVRRGLYSFAHLEKIKKVFVSGTGFVNAVDVVAPSIGGSAISLPWDPEDTGVIFATTGDRLTQFGGGQTFVRVKHGEGAGVYVVYETQSFSGSAGVNAVLVRDLDGNAASLPAESNVHICFYNAHAAFGSSVVNGPSQVDYQDASLSLYNSSVDSLSTSSFLIRMSWRGVGGGIVAQVNDPEFISYQNGTHASGSLLSANLYAPAWGGLLAVTGSPTLAEEARAAAGPVLRIASYKYNYTVAADPGVIGEDLSSFPFGFASWTNQDGKDPGSVFTRTDRGTSSSLPDTTGTKLTNSAAMIVGRAGAATGTTFSNAPAGRGSAIEARGSVWIYRGDEDHSVTPVSWADGGLYVEDVAGLGRWAYPMWGVYEPDNHPSEGAADVTQTGWSGPTQLGHPNVAYPDVIGVNDPQGALGQKDYAIFDYPHIATFRIPDTTAPVDGGLIDRPYNRFVGCALVVTEPGHAHENEVFVIAGVKEVALNDLYLSLHHNTITAITDPGNLQFRILGQRWERAYLNISDYAQIGTGAARNRYELPALGSSPDAAGNNVSAAEHLLSALVTAQDGIMSRVSAGTGSLGSGIGDEKALVAKSSFQGANPRTSELSEVTIVTQPSEARSTVFGSSSSWAADHTEPRTPFPGAGIVAGPPATYDSPARLDQASPGSLLSQEFALEHISTNSPSGCEALFDDTPQGSLMVRKVADGGNADVVKLWKRGISGYSNSLVNLRARVVFAYSTSAAAADGSITLRIQDELGTVLAAESASVLSANDTLRERSLDWELADLLRGRTGLSDNPLKTLHLTIELTVPDAGVWRFSEIRLDTQMREARLDGPLRVQGPITTAGHRFATPAFGYDTRGPADADLLNPLPQGRAEGNSLLAGQADLGSQTSFIWGDAEGYGVGAWSAPVDSGTPAGSSSTWYRPVFHRDEFFFRGPYSAGIKFTHPYFDPLWYARISQLHDEGALNGANAGEGIVHGALVRLPGRTGFVVPFDPPHGSRLGTLQVLLSAVPQKTVSGVSWGMWHSLPTAILGEAQSSVVNFWETQSVWDAVAGVRVKLWRQNVSFIGDKATSVDFAFRAANSGPRFGQAELLLVENISLGPSAPTLTAAEENESPRHASYDILSDRKVVGSWDIGAHLSTPGAGSLMVDRRQFTYFMTVEFYCGARQVLGGVYQSPSVARFSPQEREIFFGSTSVMAVTEDNLEGGSTAPGYIKFRGASLGYMMDRGLHGGWGG